MNNASRQRPTVLVVENHADVRQLIGNLIQALGWEPIQVDGVAAALDVLKGDSIDAIISDWELDDGDGRSVILAANEIYQRVLPTVVVTSYASDELRRLAREAGAIDLLEKPFRLGQLTETLCPALKAIEEVSETVN